MSQLGLPGLNPADINLKCQHFPGWLGTAIADKLLANSLELEWQQNNWKMMGQSGPLPRRELIYGDAAYTYSYSNGRVILTAEPWPHWLESLRDVIEITTGYSFPLVIGNRYDSGRDHIGWHDDGRTELGPMPAISSLSLGETRRFQVRRKPSYQGEITPITTFELKHGDLIVMPPGFQEGYKHKLMKETRECRTRVNWTFRPWVGAK
ncbi:MAG: alpha-ketoglutarate-dependent dioxygenase AlkB [Cyanobacteria bacterium P01_F01_bin.3]